MLIVRQKQMAVLQMHAEKDFVKRVTSRLSRTEGESLESVERFVKEGLEAARGFSLTREADVAHFLEITWDTFGELPPFPRAALAILCRRTANTSSKLEDYAAWIEEVRAEYEEGEGDA